MTSTPPHDAPAPTNDPAQQRSDRARQVQRWMLRALPVVRRGLQRSQDGLRRLRGQRTVVEFFHQVDDPYSQLALEAIPALQDRYDIDFVFHLVGQTDRLHAPEPEMLADYARRDCALVAPHYGLAFPSAPCRPEDSAIQHVESLLAPRLAHPDFLSEAISAGRALWGGADPASDTETSGTPNTGGAERTRALAAGNALRAKRRHYSGALFWLAGEWYWGVDRLHHLERRLRSGGDVRPNQPDRPLCFDRPPLDPGTAQCEGGLELEIFPSLRSPYTAMIFDRSLEVARAANVPVSVRPVLPMIMRGAPVPTAKGLYIMMDAVREAEHLTVPFGDMLDPVGRPVERGFSLWPFARDQGRGPEYISAFLRAAFAEGRPVGSDAALRRIVEEAGLDFEAAQPHLDNEVWRDELEANRKLMYDELGLWGVPSYRLRGPQGESDLCIWGQDRLWLVAAEIKRRIALSESR